MKHRYSWNIFSLIQFDVGLTPCTLYKGADRYSPPPHIVRKLDGITFKIQTIIKTVLFTKKPSTQYSWTKKQENCLFLNKRLLVTATGNIREKDSLRIEIYLSSWHKMTRAVQHIINPSCYPDISALNNILLIRTVIQMYPS